MSPIHLALVYLVALIWGFNFIAVATVLQQWPPVLFTIVRFSLVLLALLPFMRRPPGGQWRRLVGVALANGAFHFSLFFLAIRMATDISSVAILLQTYVPFSALLATVLLGERMGWKRIGAIALAFGGVLMVSFDPGVFAQLPAVGVCLASAFFLGLGTTLMRGLKGLNPFAFQGWIALLSIPVLVPLSLWLEPESLELLKHSEVLTWSGAAYSALISSIVGHGLVFWLVQRNEVTSVTPHLLLAPILAVAFGVLVWGDQPGWRLYLGGAMVLAGVLVVALRSRRRAPAVAARAVTQPD